MAVLARILRSLYLVDYPSAARRAGPVLPVDQLFDETTRRWCATRGTRNRIISSVPRSSVVLYKMAHFVESEAGETPRRKRSRGLRSRRRRTDVRVLAFTLTISILAAAVFGLVPAWRSSRGGESRGRERLRAAFVIGEVAMAVVLLVGAGLLLRTFSHLLGVKLGFQPEQVLTMRMFVLGDPARRSNLVENILDRVENLPQVQAAGTIQFLPLSGFTNNGPFHFVGRPLPAEPRNMESDVSTVSRGYFAALGIPVLRGRPFIRQDRLDSPVWPS